MKDGFKVTDADWHVLEPSYPFDRHFKEARRKILWDNPKRLYSLEV